MVEMDVLGDAAVVKMAIASVVDVVADVVTATIITTTTPTKPNPIHLDFILRQNGTNFPLKSMTRFRRSVTSKMKQIIGNILVEQVTAIIGAMHQAQLANHTDKTELTSNT